MKLYNTITQSVETFQPRDDEVTVYVCGITPYDTTHLGHAFTYSAIDILIRYLESRHLKVRYVQNITDVDDDILRRAKEVNGDWRELGNRWTQHYIRDMQNLNVRPPEVLPRASDVIPEIIANIQRLIGVGVAYEAGGNVYYSVDAWPEFGKLSHLPREKMLPVANERGNHPDDPNKRDPLDFVLWQAQAPGEPGWPSPWGSGRPGWHIECSSMATRFLGKVVDIHGGGADLCFPHHECEIAQAEPISRTQPFVRYWFHTAMVRYQGEKMSKSLGNLVMIRDLLKLYTPDALRLYLGNHHYRDEWTYDEKDLQKAQKWANQLREAVTVTGGDGQPLNPDTAWGSFTHDMDNDLDTPGAVQTMRSLADDIQDAAAVLRNVKKAQEALCDFGHIFGLRLDDPDAEKRVVDGWNEFIPHFQEDPI